MSNELTAADFNQIWDGLNRLHVDLMLRQIKAVHAKNVNGYGHLRRGTKK